MNHKRITCITFLVTLLAVYGGSRTLADEEAAPEKVLPAFLKAFGEADTAAMGNYYADEVAVYRGSTLLDKKYGGLGGDDGKDKDQKVKKEALLKAYDKAIEALGGKEDWVGRNKNLKDQEMKFATVTPEQGEKDKVKEAGMKAGDVIAVVIPKGDSLMFVLRKNDKGKWLIIGEHWD